MIVIAVTVLSWTLKNANHFHFRILKAARAALLDLGESLVISGIISGLDPSL